MSKSEVGEYRLLDFTEDDKRFLEWELYLSHKICEVFGISQQELMGSGEGTKHSDTHVPSVPRYGFIS